MNDVRGVGSIVGLAGPGSVHCPSQLGLSTSPFVQTLNSLHMSPTLSFVYKPCHL